MTGAYCVGSSDVPGRHYGQQARRTGSDGAVGGWARLPTWDGTRFVFLSCVCFLQWVPAHMRGTKTLSRIPVTGTKCCTSSAQLGTIDNRQELPSTRRAKGVCLGTCSREGCFTTTGAFCVAIPFVFPEGFLGRSEYRPVSTDRRSHRSFNVFITPSGHEPQYW